VHEVNQAGRGNGGNRKIIKMNILYLTNHLNIGGISSHVLSLAKGFKKRGHNVYIASSGGELLTRFVQEGITYFPIPIKTKSELSPKIMISMCKLSSLIKEKKIDIIHSHSRTTQVLGCLLSRNSAVVHLSTCHGFFKTRLSRRLFPCWGRRIIAISKEVREHLIRDFKVEEKRISLIPNGVDCEKFFNTNPGSGTEMRKRIGLGNGPIIGIIARLSDVKGHIYLIQAMASVLEKAPGAKLLIVGEGKMKKNLMDLSETLQIEKNVVFLPSVAETTDVLSVMDIFVLPSLKEGLGLSLMEAMAAGRAVIGSDIGGIRSLLKDRDNGLLVRPADKSGLASAMIELLNNPGLRLFLGNNARVFIKHNFSQERMLLETEKLYRACLDN